jgi:hypothetical protein
MLAVLAAGEKAAGETPKEKEAAEASNAAAQIALAQDLADRGRKAHSPLALLTAAEILGKIDVPIKELKDKPEVSGKAGADGEAPALLDRVDEAKLLVEDAKSMANRLVKDGAMTPEAAAAVKALAKDVVIKESRAAIGGVKRKNGWLAPGQSHTYRIDFDGWSMARVFAFSEGRSPLQLTVTNTNERVRGEDTGWNPSASWMPGERSGGVFIIRVTNVGDHGTPYRLVTN